MQSLVRLLLHPIVAFNLIWCIILPCHYGHLLLFYDPGWTLLFVYAVSLMGFLVGALAARSIKRTPRATLESPADGWQSAPERILVFWSHRLIWPAWGLSIAILVFNLRDGLPPIFQLGSTSGSNYLEYGSFNAVWQATALATVVLSVFERRWRRWPMRFVPLMIFILYLTRGYVIIALIAWTLTELLVRDLKYKVQQKTNTTTFKTFGSGLLLFGAALLIFTAMWALGELRTGSDTMADSMEVNPAYRFMGPGVVWILAYISSPMDNVVYWLDRNMTDYGGRITIYNLVPGFLGQQVVDFDRTLVIQITRQANNFAFSYLGQATLDFGWGGVFVLNVFYGLVGAVAYRARAVSPIGCATYTYVLAAIYLLGMHSFLLAFPYLLSIALIRVTLMRRRFAPQLSAAF